MNGQLRAGLARVEITPELGVPNVETRQATVGVNDPLYARVLVLEAGDVSIALVVADLAWLYSDRILSEARRLWGIDHVILQGTHTHSAPHPADGTWFSTAEDNIIAAIGEAAANLFPARIGAGRGPVENDWFAYNRRVVDENGSVQMLWSNPARKQVGPVDNQVRVIRIDEEGGGIRAVLLHYGAHPVVQGLRPPYYSADYPGAAVARVERELGEGVTAIFLQGAGGDVHPYETGLQGEHGARVVRETGAALGESALLVARAIEPAPAAAPGSIRAMVGTIPIAHRTRAGRTVDAGVMAIVVNDEIALVPMSGEPFVELQLDLARLSPLKHTFLLGYADFGVGHHLGYLPTRQAAREGGHGASIHTSLEPGGPERMISRAAAMIRRLHAERLRAGNPALPLPTLESFTLANPETGSPEFIGSTTVMVSGLPVPDGYRRYQVTETGDAAALDPAGWKPVGGPLAPVTFARPPADGPVTLYAWFAGDAGEPLEFAEGTIFYTACPPVPVMVEAPAPRVTAGYTVRITGEALDAGSSGGESANGPLGIHRLAARCAGDENCNLTPEATFVTVAGPGEYRVRLEVINAAGNRVLADGYRTVTVRATGALPAGGGGELFVAPGNLGADPDSDEPFRSWATAAATIQQAVDAAPEGATIILAPGTYRGPYPYGWNEPGVFDNVVSLGKPVRLLGAAGREEVVIDGGGRRRGVRLDHAGAVVENLTIANGRAPAGGGARIGRSGGTLRGCLITGNLAFGSGGGGVRADGPNALIENCDIVANSAEGDLAAGGAGGGGLDLHLGPRVTGSLIADNRANGSGGGILMYAGRTVLENCRIIGNHGAGVMTRNSHPLLLRNCLVAHNRGDGVTMAQGTVQLENCTVAANRGWGVTSSHQGGDIAAADTIVYGNVAGGLRTHRGAISAERCCVQAPDNISGGTGNIAADPRFVDAEAGDFGLQAGSPCAQSGWAPQGQSSKAR